MVSSRGIKPGDYLVTENGQIYRITNKVTTNGQATYDIASMFKVYYPDGGFHDTVRKYGVSHGQLRHLGRVVPEEEATDLFKILYD